MVAASTLVHVTGQKKKCFVSDCNWNEGFVLVSLLLEFVSAPNSFRRAFVICVFKRNHSRKLTKFTISLSTELAKDLFLPQSQSVSFPSWAFAAVEVPADARIFSLHVFLGLEFSSFAWFSCAEYSLLLLTSYGGKQRCQTSHRDARCEPDSDPCSGWDRLCRGRGHLLPNLQQSHRDTWPPMAQAPKLSGSLRCPSRLKTLGSCRLGTNLPCMCWVVHWSHVTASNLPSKGNFLVIFKFYPYFASLQPPGPEV